MTLPHLVFSVGTASDLDCSIINKLPIYRSTDQVAAQSKDPPAPSGNSCVGQITQLPPDGARGLLTLSSTLEM